MSNEQIYRVVPCVGNGNCLFKKGNEWMKSEFLTCAHGCVPQKCVNFEVCGQIERMWVLEANKMYCKTCVPYAESKNFYNGNVIPMKCKNFAMCGQIERSLFLKKRNMYCRICYPHPENDLRFIEKHSQCMRCKKFTEIMAIFPAHCGHSVCVECVRVILQFDEHWYHLSPEEYGCKPCPNKCKNPKVGRQCGCAFYELVKREWYDQDDASWTRWCNEQMDSVENAKIAYSNACKCPICHKSAVIPKNTQHLLEKGVPKNTPFSKKGVPKNNK